ncbi:cytochrome c biogenesis CcdA family protein [Metabacillus endolithicus]|uniref:Cytochrome c biogenesis CcdA family protein n=1 Tax=Metabacillus endolithicus TaxID=1535204 RepID=A0ABW5BT98_9BACI|nr:cytochrome c biogenesis protein CcdA [Metabacillus endolithicus]UPG62845.1 cytochrome c biogenesis protein CcdA [Metabacillus endolithicus]
MVDVNLLLAFGAGLLSFLSPCCLPLYPAFLSYITGLSVRELKEGEKRTQRLIFFHTISFLVGFSIIFIVLGLSTTLISQLFIEYQDFIRQLGAVFIIFFGFVTIGILKPKALLNEKKIKVKRRPSGYGGSVLLGIGYAAGWTPCVGPILASVIAFGLYTGTGLLLMIAYMLGFSLPFLVMSFFVEKSKILRRYSQKLMKISGLIMIVMGFLLFFDLITKLTSFLIEHVYKGFTGF